MFARITFENPTLPVIGKGPRRKKKGAKATGLALAAILAAAPAAQADTLVPPDPWQVVHAVRTLGPAEVRRDDFRDPQITARLQDHDGHGQGLPYEVSFYGCDLGRDCQSILLTLRLWQDAWASPPGEGGKLAQKLAGWNRAKLIGRAWRDDTGRLVLDHAVVMGPGLDEMTLKQTLSAWASAMQEFAEHVDFRDK